MTSNAGHTAGAVQLDGQYVTNANGATIADCGKSPTLSQVEKVANAQLIAEAFTVAHETGLTPRQLAERCEKLEAALEFYADPRRYEGPNQRPIEGDKFAQPNDAYLRDVTRDGGHIAAVALRAKATAGGA